MKNKIASLYKAVSAPVAATREALTARLQDIRNSITSLYNNTKTKLGYGQTLQDIVEKEAESEYVGIEDIKHLYPRNSVKTDGIDDVKYLFDEHDMKMVEDGRRIKTWRLTQNLNQPLTETIMKKAQPDIDMRTKVIYSFFCNIYQGGGKIKEYGKTKPSNGTLSSIQEIEEFIIQCETKRLDLDMKL